MSQPPAFLQPFLWSYDLSQMDIERDKRVIVRQILDYGTKPATDWLRRTYTAGEIRAGIRDSVQSDWSKKSLALWELVYDARPDRQARFS